MDMARIEGYMGDIVVVSSHVFGDLSSFQLFRQRE